MVAESDACASGYDAYPNKSNVLLIKTISSYGLASENSDPS